jgi:hypothetical protein
MGAREASLELRRPAAVGSALEGLAPRAGARTWSRDRPRLLSYLGRWGRARRWLPADARRVIDVGCAFGYGTVALAARAAPRPVVRGS